MTLIKGSLRLPTRYVQLAVGLLGPVITTAAANRLSPLRTAAPLCSLSITAVHRFFCTHIVHTHLTDRSAVHPTDCAVLQVITFTKSPTVAPVLWSMPMLASSAAANVGLSWGRRGWEVVRGIILRQGIGLLSEWGEEIIKTYSLSMIPLNCCWEMLATVVSALHQVY